MASPGHPDEEGRGRQAGELVAWRSARACASATRLADWRQEDDGGGGLGWLAGPEAPGKVSLFYLCFLISVICFDLNKILNHLFTLCQFLQELDILFQSSPTGGIIFGHILIYITNIFPMQIFMH